MNTKANNLGQIIYRFICIALGAILLAAGVLKGLDLQLFSQQIRQYGILPENPWLIDGFAWFMVMAELGFGTALIVNWRPRAALCGVTAMLLVFIGALIWAIVGGGVDDCGCFGPAAVRSPGAAVVEDLILLVMAITAWRLRKNTILYRHRVKGWVVAAACIGGMIIPAATGALSGTPSLHASAPPDKVAGIELRSPTGSIIDLQAETSLVAVMATDCHHCRNSVPLLNEIVADLGESIAVYGVAADSQSEIDRFVEENFTFYPILPIAEKSVISLLDGDPFPKFLLIRKGHILAQWQDRVPLPQALIDLVTDVKGA